MIHIVIKTPADNVIDAINELGSKLGRNFKVSVENYGWITAGPLSYDAHIALANACYETGNVLSYKVVED